MARATAVGLVAAYVLAYLLLSDPLNPTRRGLDTGAYWLAAERLTVGEPLYLGGEGAEVYRYAPWFAWVWVPLSQLPYDLVLTGLQLLLVAAVAWLTFPFLWSPPGILAAGLIVPQVMEYVWLGNIDAFVLVALALHATPIGPVLVGAAGSLKIAPLAFVGIYLLAREWKRAAIAMATFAVLWLPILWHDVGAWADTAPTELSPFTWSPLAGIASLVVVGSVMGWIAFRDRRFAPLAAAVIAMVASPRLHLYNIGYLLAAVRR